MSELRRMNNVTKSRKWQPFTMPVNNTINFKEILQRLPELQIAWLQMDRDHQQWGCSAIGKSLEMRNENFAFNVYANCVHVEVRSVTEERLDRRSIIL
jgi:hypothetical protein